MNYGYLSTFHQQPRATAIGSVNTPTDLLTECEAFAGEAGPHPGMCTSGCLSDP